MENFIKIIMSAMDESCLNYLGDTNCVDTDVRDLMDNNTSVDILYDDGNCKGSDDYENITDIFVDPDKQYDFKHDVVDTYGGSLITDSCNTVYIPNQYGQEDNWNNNECDYILITKDKIYLNQFKKAYCKIWVKRFIIDIDIDIPIEKLSGKRGYYFIESKGYILIRTFYDFYNTLPDKYKSEDTKDWVSAPHMKINIISKDGVNGWVEFKNGM